MIKGFKNVNVLTEKEGIVKKTILVENGKIAKIVDDCDCEGLISLDDSKIVVPGFIDKHVHGGNNSDGMYSSLEDAKNIAESAGWCNDLKNINIVFKNSMIKNHFIDSLSTARPDINVINCNCSVDKFFENDFSGFLVFNNLKRCQHSEIIEEIKNHKGVLLS